MFGYASNDKLALEIAEAGGEDFGRDSCEIELKLGETTLACAEIPDEVGSPGTGDQIHTLAQRTLYGWKFDFGFAALDHDTTYRMVTRFGGEAGSFEGLPHQKRHGPKEQTNSSNYRRIARHRTWLDAGVFARGLSRCGQCAADEHGGIGGSGHC